RGCWRWCLRGVPAALERGFGRAERWRFGSAEEADTDPRALPWFAWLRVPGLDAPEGGWAGRQRRLPAQGTGAPGLRIPLRRPVSRALPQHAEPGGGQQPGGRGECPGAHRRPLPARHRGRRSVRALARRAARGGRDRRLLLLEGRRVGRAHAALLPRRHPAQQRRRLDEAGVVVPPVPAWVAPVPASSGQDPLGWTALVECGATWGSGVLLAPRMLLTCRHVVEARAPLHVTPAAGPGRDAAVLRGRVVFATEDSSPFDVAVVELEESVPGFVPPYLADTFLPGIVASNTRDTGAGTTYPHLNFCVPITVLQPLIACYRRTGDPDAFAGLNRVGEEVRATWQLQQRPGPRSKL
uniref:Peroxisomal leader peptide-processing protease n=1 Tax=Malurus cyaneus samueli TaxID=2593467 RepID=A0A8C5X7L8_9PASS